MQREIADRLVHESQIQHDDIKRRHAELREIIDGMFAELSNVKADRNLLSGLFVEVAKCLNQDQIPKGAATGNPALTDG